MNNKVMIQQRNVFSTREEPRMSIVGPIADRRDRVVCPKPRRLGPVSSTVNDVPLGDDVLDVLLFKGGCGSEPFFCGSPPSRVANPLIQDLRFGVEKLALAPSPAAQPPSPSPSAGRKGGCVRANFGNNPTVRIEGGFDCLDRDRRHRSIPALA